MRELYNLEEDIGETTNLYDQHPEVVAELSARADRCREDLGCQATGIEGRNIRRPGRVEDPHPLTQYDPEHPYIIAMYDLDEAG